MRLKKLGKLITFLMGMHFALVAYAAETIAKEEITPPRAEGAMTLDDIPPITISNKIASEVIKTPPPPTPPQPAPSSSTQKQTMLEMQELDTSPATP